MLDGRGKGGKKLCKLWVKKRENPRRDWLEEKSQENMGGGVFPEERRKLVEIGGGGEGDTPKRCK